MPAEARSNDARLARAAMAVDDTASALAARRRITESYGHGSPQRQSSWTEQLRIQVVAEDAETAMEALGAFRRRVSGRRRVGRTVGRVGVAAPRRRDARGRSGGAERHRGTRCGAGTGLPAPGRRGDRGGHRRPAGIASRSGAVPRDRRSSICRSRWENSRRRGPGWLRTSRSPGTVATPRTGSTPSRRGSTRCPPPTGRRSWRWRLASPTRWGTKRSRRVFGEGSSWNTRMRGSFRRRPCGSQGRWRHAAGWPGRGGSYS